MGRFPGFADGHGGIFLASRTAVRSLMLAGACVAFTFMLKTAFIVTGSQLTMIIEADETKRLPGPQPRIPRRLIFTYKYNFLAEPPQEGHELFHRNVLNTIDIYQKSWYVTGEPVEVWFLDNPACEQAIKKAAPELLPDFVREKQGRYKADICRLAALYLTGGYYFDIDIRTVEAVDLPPNTTFSSPLSGKAFFQAFLATTPANPIIEENFRLLRLHYDVRHRGKEINGSGPEAITLRGMQRDLMGPKSLFRSFYTVMGKETVQSSVEVPFLLEEINLDRRDDNFFPNIKRQAPKSKKFCNMVVVDGSGKVYFFSRFLGAGRFCPLKDRPIPEYLQSSFTPPFKLVSVLEN